MSQSYYHTFVTSDGMVTVMVTNYKITKKGIEKSRRIMLYNMCNILYVDLKENSWSFRVG